MKRFHKSRFIAWVLTDHIHSAGEIFGNVLLVRLKGATTDFEKLSITPESLNNILAEITVAAQYLHGVVRHLFGHSGGDQLHPVGVDPLAGFVEVHTGRRVIKISASRHVLRVRISNISLDLAKGVDWLAEGGTLVRVARHDLHAAASDSGRHGGNGHALNLKITHHMQEAVTFFS